MLIIMLGFVRDIVVRRFVFIGVAVFSLKISGTAMERKIFFVPITFRINITIQISTIARESYINISLT